MAAPQVYRTPLEAFTLPTGLTGVKGLLKLLVRTRWHHFEEFTFHADPGTSVTTLPLSTARRHDIAYAPAAISCETRTPGGKIRLPVHVAHLVVRVPGWKHRDFIWPCHVVDYPAEEPLPLLGLSGVINDVFLFFDSTYALEAPFGWVVLQELLKEQATPAPAAIQA